MDPRKAAQIINIVRDDAAKGKKYADGDVSSDILLNGNVCFVEVPLQLYDKYLGTAIWFYRKSPRPFPCLQLVWPDRDGRFPWETGFDPIMKRGSADREVFVMTVGRVRRSRNPPSCSSEFGGLRWRDRP